MDITLEKELQVYVGNFNIFNFDTSSIEKRFRIVSETCDIEVNGSVKKLVEFIKLNEGKTLSYLIERFSTENCVTKKDVVKIFSLLFEKGVLASKKQDKKEIEKKDYFRNKMEHLWFRVRLIDTEKHADFFKFFSFVFSKPFVITILSIFLILDTVFIYSYFFTAWREQLIYYSALDYFYIFSLFGWISLFLHEVGHIVAAKRYNAETGGIGLGVYYFMLIGYADIHETWNLPRSQRKVVSVAGFYWDMIFVLPFYILCLYSNSKAICDFILLFHLSFVTVFNPFLKMDGYWFLCDTLGVPNLQNRIKVFFFQYLPSKFLNKNESVINPFHSYPKKVFTAIKIYVVIFIVFMVIFLSLFLKAVVDIGLNLNTDILNPLRMIIAKWNSNVFNNLLRDSFILLGAVMFFASIIGKYLINLFKKILFPQKVKLNTDQ